MGGNGEDKEKKKADGWLDKVGKIAACTAFFAFLITGIVNVYKNAMEKPNLSCYVDESKESISFEIQDDFRSVSLLLYPELEIRYENDILLYIHMVGRYDPVYVQFDSTGKAEARRTNQEYYDQIVNYLQQKVKNAIREMESEELSESICDHLVFEESILGGIMYMSKADGQNIKQFCIIEKDGMIREAALSNEEVIERLYNWEIDFSGNDMIDYAELNQVVQVVTEELIHIYKE